MALTNYELIYPGDFANRQDLFATLEHYFHFYNYECPHQALAYQTSADFYEQNPKDMFFVLMGAPPPGPPGFNAFFTRMDPFLLYSKRRLPYNRFACQEDGAPQGCARAPKQARNGWRPSGRPSDQPAALSKNDPFFVQITRATSIDTATISSTLFVLRPQNERRTL